MDVLDYLAQEVDHKLSGDSSRVGELFDNDSVFERLKSLGKNSDWYHYEPKTFDGWYLVQSNGNYLSYYQERGGKYHQKRFETLKEAAEYFYAYSRYFAS